MSISRSLSEHTYSDNQLFRIRAISEKMKTKALEIGWGQSKAEDMYMLGFLSDIGTGATANSKNNHAVLLLARNGYQHHFEVGHKDRPVDNPTDEILLLWWAELTTAFDGKDIPLRYSLVDTQIKFGKNSYEYKNRYDILQILYTNGERLAIDVTN